VKVVWISAGFWLAVATVAVAIFFVSNLAGPSGTPTYFLPTLNVLAIGAVIYLIGLILFRRPKRG
jgi:hypothetical protein